MAARQRLRAVLDARRAGQPCWRCALDLPRYSSTSPAGIPDIPEKTYIAPYSHILRHMIRDTLESHFPPIRPVHKFTGPRSLIKIKPATMQGARKPRIRVMNNGRPVAVNTESQSQSQSQSRRSDHTPRVRIVPNLVLTKYSKESRFNLDLDAKEVLSEAGHETGTVLRKVLSEDTYRMDQVARKASSESRREPDLAPRKHLSMSTHQQDLVSEQVLSQEPDLVLKKISSEDNYKLDRVRRKALSESKRERILDRRKALSMSTHEQDLVSEQVLSQEPDLVLKKISSEDNYKLDRVRRKALSESKRERILVRRKALSESRRKRNLARWKHSSKTTHRPDRVPRRVLSNESDLVSRRVLSNRPDSVPRIYLSEPKASAIDYVAKGNKKTRLIRKAGPPLGKGSTNADEVFLDALTPLLDESRDLPTSELPNPTREIGASTSSTLLSPQDRLIRQFALGGSQMSNRQSMKSSKTPFSTRTPKAPNRHYGTATVSEKDCFFFHILRPFTESGSPG